jgi:hypothetical protein
MKSRTKVKRNKSKVKRNKSKVKVKRNKSKVKRNKSKVKITYDGNEKFKNELITILKSHEKDSDLFQYILNIFLVFADVRDGTLIEYNNLKNDKKRIEAKTIINNFVEFLNTNSKDKLVQCHTSLDYRIMITKNQSKLFNKDENIGEILNFICIGHDYGNDKVDRLSIHIKEKTTNCDIYSESCEFSKIDIKNITEIFTERIKKWNIATAKYNLPYEFEFYTKDNISQITRLRNIDNKSYIEKNKNDYINDLYNYFHSHFLEYEDDNYSFSKYIKKYSLFKLIYILTIEYDIFISLYKDKNLDEIEEIQLKLFDFDKELLEKYNQGEDNFNLVIDIVKIFFNEEFMNKFKEQLNIYKEIYGKI